jgi:hypothetical protein
MGDKIDLDKPGWWVVPIAERPHRHGAAHRRAKARAPPATAARYQAHRREQAIDCRRADRQEQSANRLVDRQLAMPLQSRQQHRNDRLQPLRAEPVRCLPQHDQGLLDVLSVPSMDPPLNGSAIADLRPQQPDCVLAA